MDAPLPPLPPGTKKPGKVIVRKKPDRIDYSYRPDVFMNALKSDPRLAQDVGIFLPIPGDTSVPAGRKIIQAGRGGVYFITPTENARAIDRAVSKVGTDQGHTSTTGKNAKVKSDTVKKPSNVKTNKDKSDTA